METTTDILSITTSETPEYNELFSLSGSLLGMVFFIVIFCGCICKHSSFRDQTRGCSCCDNISCSLSDCESTVWRCWNKVSCVCSVCGVCKSGVRRCWGTITNTFSRRTESNCTTGNTNIEAPPTDMAPRLFSVIVDPAPSMTLPPSYDSIVTDPSQPPPSYEEAMR